jgi:hypothetical protein
VANGSVVTVTVKFEVVHELKFTFDGDDAAPAKVTFDGKTYSDGDVTIDKKLKADGTTLDFSADRPIKSVSSSGLDEIKVSDDKMSFSAKLSDASSEEVEIQVTFEPQYKLSFKFVNDIDGSNKVTVDGTNADESVSISGYIPGEEVVITDATRKISKVEGLDGFVRDSDAKGGKGKIPSGGADGDEIELTITFAKLNYNLKLKISGAADSADNAVRLYSATNTLRSDGDVSGPYYVDEHVPVFAPEGYHFKSISSPVITNVSIDSGDAWHSATFDVKENSTYNDGVD